MFKSEMLPCLAQVSAPFCGSSVKHTVAFSFPTPLHVTTHLPSRLPRCARVKAKRLHSKSFKASLVMPTEAQLVDESTPLLRDSETDEPVGWKETWRCVRPYLYPPTPRLRLLAGFSLFCAVSKRGVALLPPYAYKLAVDALSADLMTGALSVPYAAVALYVCTKLATIFLEDLYDHLLGLSLSYHLERKTGEVVKVVDRGIDSIDTLANALLFTLLPTFVEAVAVTVIFLRLGSPFIALTIAVTVTVYCAFTITVTTWRNKIRVQLNEIEDKAEDLSKCDLLYDMLNARSAEKAIDKLINYETVKTFGMEKEEVAVYEELETECVDKYILLKLTLNALTFGQEIIQRMGVGVAMLLGARVTVVNALSPGSFVLIVTYVTQLFQPLVTLGASYRVITQAATDLERCVRIFKTGVSVEDDPNATDLDVDKKKSMNGLTGSIRFENVSFRYKSKEKAGTNGVSAVTFEARPGKTVALVGESGSGKSTITRLLLRFYDPDSGTILFHGKDIRSYTQRSLRRNIGVVAQDTMLFNDTLRYNIAYGNREATDVEILDAARSAALGPFIESLSEGLDTVVGELGVRLSGGEKQRVGFARCILKDPSIIVLDEASSALDTITEREMQANLKKVYRNRTTIIIAHRLSTIMMADEILVLGKADPKQQLASIIERGTHEELLAIDGNYARMWNAQIAMSSNSSLAGVLGGEAAV